MSFHLAKAKAFFEARKGWLGDGGHPVEPERAQARANICMACPKNSMSSGPLQLASAAIAYWTRLQIELKNELKLRVDGEKKLGTCEACDCRLRLKVHVPTSFVKETTDEETLTGLPDFCWIRTELRS